MKPDDLDKLSTLRGIDRRDFLKVSALIAAGLIIPLGCNQPQSSESIPVDEVVRLKVPPVPSGVVTVGIVRRSDTAEMVDAAIALAGGLDEIKNGDKIVIKPNLTTGYAYKTRVTTHPEVLRAVIRAVKARTDAANITVAEASSFADPSTLEVARKVGVYDVVLSEGVNWLAFEEDEYVEANCNDFRNLNFMLKVPKSLTDSRFQHFINVPMLKNHEAVDEIDAFLARWN